MHILVLVIISIPLSRLTVFSPFTYTYIANYRYSESDSDAGLPAL